MIDDFGVGYSGLDYVKRFAVDALKIDRSFVAGLGVRREDTAIVSATIAFARALDLSITADPTGLAVGEYTGRITITAAGSVNSPQTVQVAFSVTAPVLVTVSGRVLTSDGRGLCNATVAITDSNGVVPASSVH